MNKNQRPPAAKPPVLPPKPVRVEIDQEIGARLMVRNDAVNAAQRDYSSYMDGVITGMKRPIGSFITVERDDKGFPVALLFNAVVTTPARKIVEPPKADAPTPLRETG